MDRSSLPESEALPRVRFCAESKIKNTRHRRFFAESRTKNSRQRKKHLAKISLPRANFLALGKDILKNHFFTSNFFLFSTYTYTKLMLKFGTILTLFAIFNNFTSL
jgi:hypothetical protein